MTSPRDGWFLTGATIGPASPVRPGLSRGPSESAYCDAADSTLAMPSSGNSSPREVRKLCAATINPLTLSVHDTEEL